MAQNPLQDIAALSNSFTQATSNLVRARKNKADVITDRKNAESQRITAEASKSQAATSKTSVENALRIAQMQNTADIARNSITAFGNFMTAKHQKKVQEQALLQTKIEQEKLEHTKTQADIVNMNTMFNQGRNEIKPENLEGIALQLDGFGPQGTALGAELRKKAARPELFLANQFSPNSAEYRLFTSLASLKETNLSFEARQSLQGVHDAALQEMLSMPEQKRALVSTQIANMYQAIGANAVANMSELDKGDTVLVQRTRDLAIGQAVQMAERIKSGFMVKPLTPGDELAASGLPKPGPRDIPESPPVTTSSGTPEITVEDLTKNATLSDNPEVFEDVVGNAKAEIAQLEQQLRDFVELETSPGERDVRVTGKKRSVGNRFNPFAGKGDLEDRVLTGGFVVSPDDVRAGEVHRRGRLKGDGISPARAGIKFSQEAKTLAQELKDAKENLAKLERNQKARNKRRTQLQAQIN